MTRRLPALAAAAAAVVVWLASPAAAHVELDPAEAVAGSTTTLTFSFHHGGDDGSATTGLEVKLPEGASVVDVPAVEGWDASVDEGAGVVTWTGGPVADGVEARLPVVVELPSATGEVLFPTIQITETGELAWIGQAEGESEDANPAPRLTLVADPAADTTTTTADTAPTSTTNDLPGTVLEAEQRDDGDSSPGPWLIGSGIAALAAVGIGGTLMKRRMG